MWSHTNGKISRRRRRRNRELCVFVLKSSQTCGRGREQKKRDKADGCEREGVLMLTEGKEGGKGRRDGKEEKKRGKVENSATEWTVAMLALLTRVNRVQFRNGRLGWWHTCACASREDTWLFMQISHAGCICTRSLLGCQESSVQMGLHPLRRPLFSPTTTHQHHASFGMGLFWWRWVQWDFQLEYWSTHWWNTRIHIIGWHGFVKDRLYFCWLRIHIPSICAFKSHIQLLLGLKSFVFTLKIRRNLLLISWAVIRVTFEQCYTCSMWKSAATYIGLSKGVTV